MSLQRRKLLEFAIGGLASFHPGSLERSFSQSSGCSLLLDVVTNKILSASDHEKASTWLVAPGSVAKPISLWALLESGKVVSSDAIPCRRRLRLEGLNMDCSHPPLPLLVDISRAIAYSCNYATAYFAKRFSGDELAAYYGRFGFESTTGLMPSGEATGFIQRDVDGDRLQLQALGERGLRVTTLEIAKAYRELATLTKLKSFWPILSGMENAVQFGTAQAAQVAGQTVAGKTGSVRMESGLHAAWFAGFAPSRNPKVVVTVLTQGLSGAEAAAPIAGKLLRQYFSV